MLKRILAAVLAVCLVLLSFGCGKKADGDSGQPSRLSATRDGSRLAVVIGGEEQDPETYAAATELAQTFDETLMIVKYADDFYADYTAVQNIAETVAGDDNVSAIIFANGVKGTGKAVQAVREKRSDLCIVVCNPHEGSVEMKGADLVLSVDFAALGRQMVEKAKEMGAENFVFYTTNRHLKYSSVVAMRSAAEDACKAQKMTFKAASCVDIFDDGRDPETAKRYIAEDAARQKNKLGQKTALFCTVPQVQGAVAAEAVRNGMVMSESFLPSPLLLAQDLGVDLKDHANDSAWALRQLKSGKSGAAGHVATWGFSVTNALLQTALAYASAVVSGGTKTYDVDAVQSILKEYTDGAAVTVTTDANGAYLVMSDSVTL